jgi:uncharacterized membrane protein YgcG
MKRILVLFSFIALALMITAAGATTSTASSSTDTSSTSATTTLSAQDQSSLVTLSSAVLDPEVFYPGETGTITVTLTNSGTSSVGLYDASVVDPNVALMNPKTYQSYSYIGPGSNLTYTFLVTAPSTDGTYFPLFTVGTMGAQSVHYPIEFQVQSTPVIISILDEPTNFAVNAPSLVNISVVNPRQGDIQNVLIVPEGTGFEANPTNSFTGDIGAGSSVLDTFTITPQQQQPTNVTFHVTFNNGQNNVHTQDLVLPLNIGQDQTGAYPVINNLALTTSDGAYELTGDVTNAGVSDAAGMVVQLDPPVTPVQPYTNYGIGALASDDFSSFTLTFTSNDLSAVPIEVDWKDSLGDSFSNVTTLDLRQLAASLGTRSGGSGSSGSYTAAASGGGYAGGGYGGGGGGVGGIFGGGRRAGGLSSFYPDIAGGIIVIAGIVLYMKKKWILSKLKKQ